MAAVADVDPQSAIERRLDQGMDFALAIDEAAGMPRERMGQNIAGAQQRNHPLEYCIDVLTIGAALGQAPQLPKVYIDRKIGAARDLGGHFDYADTPACKAADFGMRLDAANKIAVGVRRLHRGIWIDAVGPLEIGIVVTFQASHQIG